VLVPVAVEGSTVGCVKEKSARLMQWTCILTQPHREIGAQRPFPSRGNQCDLFGLGWSTTAPSSPGEQAAAG